MNLSRGETISKWIPKAGLAFLYAGTAALCYRLYLRQAIQFPGALGTYRSDLLPHIEEGLAGTGYSLMEFLYGFLLGKLHPGIPVSVFMELCLTDLRFRVFTLFRIRNCQINSVQMLLLIQESRHTEDQLSA